MSLLSRRYPYSYPRAFDKYTMNTNLDRIALDLYGKIETRFSDIKIGDEEAKVLSKKSDIPQARFFEFEYKENGRNLGTVAITLDEDDGVVVQIGGKLSDSKHPGVFKFLRGVRQFAKDRLLNFDVQNIGKSQLDKRDYEFQAKPKELPDMAQSPIMENKMYGTARMSYQDLGEAKLIVKHTQPINLELAAGRTMHIESIWVENAQGERFKFPYKHLNGARALAEHMKHGGNLYDNIGQHICGLSEELAQLRKFKGYVGRNDTLAEAMGDITDKVQERIEQIKKEVAGLQRPAYYSAFAESFATREEQMIPEDIMSDWIDRLTIRTFNEDLKTAFPYIFRLVGEGDIPVKELSADDLLDEAGAGAQQAAIAIAKKKSGKYDKDGKRLKETPEDQFEAAIDRIMGEDEEPTGENSIFSPNKATQVDAIDKLNQILQTELKGGPDGINAIESLKGIIDDPEFLDGLKDIDPDLDARPLIQQFLTHEAPEIVAQLHFGGEGEVGGANTEPEAGATPTAPPADAGATPADAGAPPQPPVPGAEEPPAPPVAEGSDEDPPFDGPYTKRKGTVTDKSGAQHTGHSQAKHLAKAGMIKAIHNAKSAGAKLDTKLDFGHKEMTLHDCMDECGMDPSEFGFADEHQESGVQQMLKDIAGFWNHEQKNFTIGGTRAKTKIVKAFKNGEFSNATDQDLHKVLMLIDKMDPSGEHNQELGHISHLAGVQHHEPEVDHMQHKVHQLGAMEQQPSMYESPELTAMLKIAGLRK